MKSREVGRQTSLVLASAAQAASEIQSYDRALRYAILAARDGLLSPASPEAEAQLVRAAHASMLLVRLEGHRGAVLDAALSPDGHRAVTASGDTTARVWNMDTGEALFTLWGHKKAVVSAAFSPDGKRVVTASDDATARVWDVERGEAVALLAGHLDKVRSAIYSTDGRRILTCSADGTARIWDAASGKLIT